MVSRLAQRKVLAMDKVDVRASTISHEMVPKLDNDTRTSFKLSLLFVLDVEAVRLDLPRIQKENCAMV